MANQNHVVPPCVRGSIARVVETYRLQLAARIQLERPVSRNRDVVLEIRPHPVAHA